MNANKPLGGRGKRVPYKSIVKWTPEPVSNEIDLIIEDYRDMALTTREFRNIIVVDLEKLERECEIIFSQKQPTKKRIQKLLGVLREGKLT